MFIYFAVLTSRTFHGIIAVQTTVNKKRGTYLELNIIPCKCHVRQLKHQRKAINKTKNLIQTQGSYY